LGAGIYLRRFDNITKTVPTGDTGITWNPVYSQTNNSFSGGTYDSNGNLLTDGFHTYTWNQDNKLTAITDMSIGSMSYDAGGNLVEWKTGSTYTEKLWSPIGNIGKMSKSNITDLRIPLPGGSTTLGGLAAYFAHKDWLGSTRLESSRGNRTFLEDRAFAPYGEVYLPFGTAAEVNFTGDNSDLTAGTYDTPNRELNPNVGRWLSVDTSHAGWNPYAYSSNPLGETDPTGLEPLADPVGSQGANQATQCITSGEINCNAGYKIVVNVSAKYSDNSGFMPGMGSAWAPTHGLAGYRRIMGITFNLAHNGLLFARANLPFGMNGLNWQSWNYGMRGSVICTSNCHLSTSVQHGVTQVDNEGNVSVVAPPAVGVSGTLNINGPKPGQTVVAEPMIGVGKFGQVGTDFVQDSSGHFSFQGFIIGVGAGWPPSPASVSTPLSNFAPSGQQVGCTQSCWGDNVVY
jgi:RHS repeat-associated protein